jgi:hypothetical protein
MTPRTPTGRTIATVISAVLLTVAFSRPALAQRGGGGGGAAGGGGPVQMTRLETLEADFKLTKDQKKAVKSILDDAHKGAAPTREALTRTRTALAAAIVAGKSQAEIDAAVNAYAEQAAAMTAVEMKALAQVMESLDKDQRANQAGVRSAFFLMRGIFLDNKKWDEIPDARGY